MDFLAFKDIVEETKNSPGELRRLVRALQALGEIGDLDDFESKQVSQFSDHIVLSWSVDEISGAFWMLNSMALTVIDLVDKGYLLRGAVVVGDLYHSRDHIVGPGLVFAHELESKVAKVPRILVDESVIRTARRRPAEHHSRSEELKYINELLRRDEDGWRYFDYMNWQYVVAAVGGSDELYGDYLLHLNQMVHRGMSHKDGSVREKYSWINRHLREAVEKLRAIPKKHAYRMQSPYNCDVADKIRLFE